MDSNYPGQNSPYPSTGSGQVPTAPITPAPVTPPPTVPPTPIIPAAPPIPITPPPQISGIGQAHAVPPPISPKPSRKKLVGVLVLLVLIAAVPLTVFISRQQQNVQQEAAPQQVKDGDVVFEIGDKQFTLADVKEVVLEQYSESDVISKDVQNIAKDILIEREILNLTATELGISVSSEERDALAEVSGMSENEAYYQLLREKVTIAKVRYLKAISIGYWVPPPRFIQEQPTEFTSEQKNQIQEQGVAGDPAIDQAERSLGSVQNPLTLARSIAANNPELSDGLAVNGYKLSSIAADEEDLISEPELYEYSDSNFDDDTRNTLFAQSVAKDQVIRVGKNDSNGGETVYKVVEINNAGAGSYADWLKNQRENLVTKEIPL